MTTPEERRHKQFHQGGAALALGVVLTLIVLDGDRTFQWILARLLGVSLIWCGYAAYLWLQEQSFWNRFFTGAFLADLALALVDLTPFRYLPPVLLLLWLRGGIIPLLYAGGIREATKGQRGWSEGKALAISVGGGLVLHYIVMSPLQAAILTLLQGHYP